MDFRKKMNLRKVRYIICGLGAATFALIMVGAALKSSLVIVLGCLLAIACIVFNLVKWRCPHCDGHLGRSEGKYCPHCGHLLEDLL